MLEPLTGDKARAGAIAATTGPTAGRTDHHPNAGPAARRLGIKTLDHKDDDHGSAIRRPPRWVLDPAASGTSGAANGQPIVALGPHAFRKSAAPTNLRSRRR